MNEIAVAACIVFAIAGFVKGVIGLGLPTIAMGLLVLIMTPREAASLLLIPSLVTNAVQMAAGPGFWRLLRRLWPMLTGIAVGTWFTADIITGRHATSAATALGAVLVVYAALGLARITVSIRNSAEHWVGALVGLITGAISGATGVFVIPAVPFLQAIGLEKDELVQALGISFMAATIALGAALSAGNAIRFDGIVLPALTLVVTLIGVGIGTAARRKIDADGFRRLFFLGLLVLGVYQVGKGVL